METGFPIVYTSADSVFQIAAHEAVVPVDQLYAWCRVAYELAVEGMGLGRVIARPRTGPAKIAGSRRTKGPERSSEPFGIGIDQPSITGWSANRRRCPTR